MTRRFWIVVDMVLVLAALLAAWFAVNAPEVARPALSAYGVVSLPEEAPELPPASFARRASDAAAALTRRPLFTAKPDAVARAQPAPPPRPDGQPIVRTVLETPIEPPKLFAALPPGQRVVNDPFRAELYPPKPRHEQYFGGHLIPPRNLDPDPDPLAAPPGGAPAGNAAAGNAEPGNAPARALPPRINPSRPEARAAALAPPPAVPRAAAPAEAPPAAAEPAVPAAAAASPDSAAPVADMTLLGVFQSRGAERALVRTASGNVRVRPGDEIEGWRVAEIGEDNVSLRRGAQTRLLEMPKDPQ